jgi:hypothetical protein
MIDRDYDHACFQRVEMTGSTTLDSVRQFEQTLQPAPPKSAFAKAVEAANK